MGGVGWGGDQAKLGSYPLGRFPRVGAPTQAAHNGLCLDGPASRAASIPVWLRRQEPEAPQPPLPGEEEAPSLHRDLGRPLTGPRTAHLDLGLGEPGLADGACCLFPQVQSPVPHPHPQLKAPLSLPPAELPVDTTLAVAVGVQSLSRIQLCDPKSSPWLCPAHFHYLSVSSSVKREG